MSATVEMIPSSNIRAINNDRTVFNTDKLAELAASIERNGLAQPITVRLLPDGTYGIVAGERRFRAMTQILAATHIPCLVRILTDEEASAIMLTENTGRCDLNPIDEANAYQARIAQFGWSEEEIAQVSGVSKDRVRNRLKLLTLIPEAQQLVATGNLTLGIAESLTRLDNNRQISALRILQSSKNPLSITAFRGICEQLLAEQQQDGLFALENFWTAQVQQDDPLPRQGKRALTGAPVRKDLPAIKTGQKDNVGTIMDRFIATLMAEGKTDEAATIGTLYDTLVHANFVKVPAIPELLK